MRLNFDGKERGILTDIDSNSGVLGLEKFLKSLEKNYFSKVSLVKCSTRNCDISMALDMVCPITLVEMLGHFNKGRWGYDTNNQSSFEKSFEALTVQNNMNIDFEELTLFFNDTSIVIKKIYDYSIPEQLHDVLTEIANHYVFLTKGLSERPYEIFVPVFEDKVQNPIFSEKQIIDECPKNYFQYWGIYLDSEEEALIYDLQKNSFIPADLDLYMLED